MFCIKCGQQLSDDVQFCFKCGNKAFKEFGKKQSEPEAEKDIKIKEQSKEDNNFPNQGSRPSDLEVFSSPLIKKNKSNKKMILWLAVIVGSIVGVAVIFSLISSEKKVADQEILITPSSPNYSQNINNAVQNFEKNEFKQLASYLWIDSISPKYMVIFSKANCEFHSCGAEIGGFFAEFNNEIKNWDIKAHNLSFAEGGSWGTAPQPNFIKLGPDKYGFIMEMGFSGQGYTEGSLHVYGVLGNKFVKMLSIRSFFSNDGAVGDKSNLFCKADVNFYQIVNDKKDFYDMKAMLKIEGNRAKCDEDILKLFGDMKEISIIFKDSVYIIPEKISAL